MKLFLLTFLFSAQAFACENFISAANAQKAIDGQALSMPLCSDTRQCLCYDGVDFEVVDLVAGKFVFNATKVAAKTAKEDAARQELQASRQRAQLIKDYFDLTNPTAAQTQAAMKAMAREVWLLRKEL